MAKVFKRAGKDGRVTWYIRYTDPANGKDIRKATKAKTKREAEFMLADIVQDIGDGTYEVKQRQRKVTFFEIADNFLAYSQAHKRSYRRDELSVRYLKAFFGNCLAKDIKPSDIDDYIAHRKTCKTQSKIYVAPATINRELACLRTIYNKAIQNRKCIDNPMKYVSLLIEDNVRDRVLSPDEFFLLLKASPPHLRPILITGYETGMRVGEILSLEWDQVDLTDGFITITADKAKTKVKRRVPISSVLRKTLNSIRSSEGPVFKYKDKPIKSIRRSFLTACKEAGIENFRYHDFRHTFITDMRRAGKQDRITMRITGHKSMSSFLRYDTVDENELKQAVMDTNSVDPGTNLAHLGSQENM